MVKIVHHNVFGKTDEKMANLKTLRMRIKSVKNTKKTTATMKLVSAAKVRRARMACEAARPFAERLNQVLVNLSSGAGEGGPLLLSGRENVKTIRLIVVGADRGLCGGFASSVNKKALQLAETLQVQGKKVEFIAVGRKVRDGLKNAPFPIVGEHTDYGKNISYELAEEVGQNAANAFEDGECDQVILVYGLFESMLRQTPTEQQLVPFSSESMTQENADEAAAAPQAGFEYEPDEEKILADLLPRNIATQVYRAMLESQASEQASRMTAMDAATRNAGDMIKKLSLQYNRGRQAAVTKELIEIISGAQAV